MKFGKWIGGGLGWVLTGTPLGAVVGFALGSLLDNVTVSSEEGSSTGQTSKGRTTVGDFVWSLLVLSASVMKADNKVMRSELDYVRLFFVRQFGRERTKEMMLALREVLKQEYNLEEVCATIRFNMEHPLRLQLLHYLFGIANADGQVNHAERAVLQKMAAHLGISSRDYASIQSMFWKDVGDAYTILEISPRSTDDAVKKAYHRMALKHHPDKVNYLGEELRKAAEEKFRKIQEAYEEIKKERGMK